MLARSLVISRLLVLPLVLLAPAAAMARTISWSGYRWHVRPAGVGDPGGNQWSNSTANVRLEGSDLILSIARDPSGCWTSAEVENRRHLGYGTYRWVVATDLSGLDSHEVLGMFTYGGSRRSNNEIDLEASHWGHRAWPSGSVTVWQDATVAGRNYSKSFRYNNRPPYVNQFRWEPGKIRFLVTDATGAVLFDRTVTRGVPTPSTEVPMINYWRFRNARPAGLRSMRISSFTWIPLGQDDTPPLLGAPSGLGGLAAPAGLGGRSGQGAAGRDRSCVRAAMRPRRLRLAGRNAGATITWAATPPTKLLMVVERRTRGRRWIRAGTIRRAAAGRARFRGWVGGRRLRPGRYRLVIGTRGGSARTLRFTVTDR